MRKLVFVSHAAHDKTMVEYICDELAKWDVDVWVSLRDIRTGVRQDDFIQEALEAASHVLVVVSKASLESPFVRDEVAYALGKDKTVIPILIEPVAKLLPARWQARQYIDLNDPSTRDDKIRELHLLLPIKPLAQLQYYLSEPTEWDKSTQIIMGTPSLDQS